MRALVCKEIGSTDKLLIEEQPDPVAGRGEVLKEASIMGIWWGTWLKKHPEESAQNMKELLDMVAKGELTPRVTESWPLENYVEAFASLTNRTARGKVILTFAD